MLMLCIYALLTAPFDLRIQVCILNRTLIGFHLVVIKRNSIILDTEKLNL